MIANEWISIESEAGDIKNEIKSASQTVERNYGIDALRVLSMYMIVVVHILNKGGVLAAGEGLWRNVLYDLLFSTVLCCVNCYALISGFVGYNEDFKWKINRFAELWIQVAFYGIVILALMKLMGTHNITWKNFVEAVLPITRDQYWYFRAYAGVFLIAPFIIRLIFSQSEINTKVFLLVSFFAFSVYGTIAAYIGGDPFELNDGYSFVWLSFLYCVGAGIKKFKWNVLVQQKKHANRVLCTVCSLCILIAVIWKYISRILTIRLLGQSWGEGILLGYTSPTEFILSLALLIIFSQFNPGSRAKKIIRFCGPACFGVYLVHMQPVLYKNYIENRLTEIATLPAFTSVIWILSIGFAVLCLGILIDRFRIFLFKIVQVDKLCLLLAELSERNLDRITKPKNTMIK